MYDTLSRCGLNEFVDFRYLPLNHIVPSNGSYFCQGMDCPSTEFDSCLVREYCWFQNPSPCSPREQLQIASYLQCFEGPFANTEQPTDATMRQPCMASAGLDYNRVMRCVSNADQLKAAQAALNSTRASMYSHIGPPGDNNHFPHLFVGGDTQESHHLANNSWVALVKVLCENLQLSGTHPAACVPVQHSLRFTLVGNVSADQVTRDPDALALFLTASRIATNFAISNATFPLNFSSNTTREPEEPSYVNVQAVGQIQLQNASGDGRVDIALRIDVLDAFTNPLRTSSESQGLKHYLSWGVKSLLGWKDVRVSNAHVVKQPRLV